jgi:hypothetical protein
VVRQFARPAIRLVVITTGSAATLFAAQPLQAQSVPPNPPVSTDAGGALATQTMTGVRPPKSQALPAEVLPGGRPGPKGLPQFYRWTEDWSATPKPDAPLVEKIRHIPIAGDDVYLSLGGEARFYYTDWNHTVLGLRPNDGEDPVQSRLRLLADLHVGPNVRAYFEIGDNRDLGATIVTPPNSDKLDITQAFIDITVPLGSAGKITLRPGRFEMPLGNGKLVDTREGLNTRFTFQGVRATYILPGEVSVDVFGVRPIAIQPGTFDDNPNHAATFTGVYVSSPNRIAGFGVDGYWYEVNRETATLREGAGRDHRDNWGGRLWKRNAAWDIDLEGNHQSGKFAGGSVDAYAILFEGGYTLGSKPLKPRVGLRANLFSGDRDLSDGKAGTFVAAFGRSSLITEGAFFGLSNLMDLYPSLTLKPRDNITVMVGPDFLWRNAKADGVYLGPSGSFAPYASSRAIGTDLNLDASWQFSKRMQFRVFETYFAASDSFQAHGGHNGNYFGLLGSYRF